MRLFLILMGLYLVGDGLIHFFNIRLISIQNVWPASAIAYANLMNAIYASFIFLAALLVLVAQTNLKKYKVLIKASAYWAIFHGLVLLYLGFTQDFSNNFSNYPSLYVWIPFYKEYLILESLMSFGFAGIIFFWSKNLKND